MEYQFFKAFASQNLEHSTAYLYTTTVRIMEGGIARCHGLGNMACDDTFRMPMKANYAHDSALSERPSLAMLDPSLVSWCGVK